MPDPELRFAAAIADRYRVDREIGRGGMATVYLAHDLKHDREVAIKVLRPELAGAIGAERFLREIRIAARLLHPHILPLHDSGEADGQLYYVMPRVEGETLRERVAREKQLPVEDAVQLTREIADALDYAHAHGVVHRDIKLENILLQGGHAIVADFGIARALTEAAGPKLTETGISLGTPAYMSPEQAGGDKDIDGRSDLYSLACVTYEMLAGQPPFTGPTAQSVIQQHLTVEPRPVAHIRATVPGQVTSAIAKALAKAPSDRFASGTEFVLSMDRALASRTPSSAPATARRIALAIGFFALAMAVYWGWSQTRRGTRTVASEQVRIAVLPFENAGAAERDYFAEGLTEEIAAQVGRIPGLVVIAHRSALQYKGTTKSVAQIGAELRVDYLLEGTVRWEAMTGADMRVRVTPRLTRVRDQSQVWSDSQDGQFADLFALQVRIASSVAGELDVAIRPLDTARTANAPTKSSIAYDYYLRANVLADAGVEHEQSIRTAIALYDSAVSTDPSFGAAYARLSQKHSEMWWFLFDRSTSRMDLARDAAERAIRVNPRLADAHVALGLFHYRGRRDYVRASEAFQNALIIEPNNADAHMGIAFIRRRQGRWSDAIAGFEAAEAVDPLDATLLSNLSETQIVLRRFDDARRTIGRLELVGAQGGFALACIVVALAGAGGDSVSAVVTQALARHGADAVFPRLSQTSGALSVRAIDPFGFLDETTTAALERTTPVAWGARLEGYYLAKAGLHARRSHARPARAYYDSARAVIAAKLRAEPDNAELHSLIGLAHAGLGRADDARREGQLALALLPATDDAFQNASLVARLARIELINGDFQRALAHLQSLPAVPAFVSAEQLETDPTWAVLRNDPRFRAAVAAIRNR